jgi:hypothetical protein
MDYGNLLHRWVCYLPSSDISCGLGSLGSGQQVCLQLCGLWPRNFYEL